MNFVKHGKSWRLRILVLLLLVSAQSYSLAHELTHAANTDNGVLCQICSAGHGLDTGIISAHVVPTSQCTHHLQIIESSVGHHNAESSPYSARAPPLNDVF